MGPANRGTATALLNYVAGQVHLAIDASGPENVRYTDRSVRHLLTHLPTRSTFEQILENIDAGRVAPTVRKEPLVSPQ